MTMRPQLTFDINTEATALGNFISQLTDNATCFDLRKEGHEITVILTGAFV
jgi:hypothetical protein